MQKCGEAPIPIPVPCFLNLEALAGAYLMNMPCLLALRVAERSAAEQEGGSSGGLKEGGCTVYIARRRRFCSHAAADGMTVCSEHHAAATAAAAGASQKLSEGPPAALNRNDMDPPNLDGPSTAAASSGSSGDSGKHVSSGQHDGKPGWAPKRNISRRLKHCSNPLASQHLVLPVLPGDWGQVRFPERPRMRLP